MAAGSWGVWAGVTISVPDDTCTLYVSKEAPRALSVEMDLSTITDTAVFFSFFLFFFLSIPYTLLVTNRRLKVVKTFP